MGLIQCASPWMEESEYSSSVHWHRVPSVRMSKKRMTVWEGSLNLPWEWLRPVLCFVFFLSWTRSKSKKRLLSLQNMGIPWAGIMLVYLCFHSFLIIWVSCWMWGVYSWALLVPRGPTSDVLKLADVMVLKDSSPLSIHTLTWSLITEWAQGLDSNEADILVCNSVSRSQKTLGHCSLAYLLSLLKHLLWREFYLEKTKTFCWQPCDWA